MWTKVDYHTRQLAPWRSMASEPACAEKSLPLDYVSMWNVNALFFSTRSRHFQVTLAIAGTLLLQLAIIFSTGLFVLEQRNVFRYNVPITTDFRFANVSNELADSRSFMAAMAAEQYDLPYAPGTNSTFAYQTFNISQQDLPLDTTITAEVDAFYPDLDCKVVNATLSYTPDPESTKGQNLWAYHYEVMDADCPLTHGESGVGLKNLAGYDTFDYYNSPYKADSPSNRWFLWVGHVDLDDKNHTYKVYNLYNHTDRGGVTSVSSISCEPKYEVGKARVVTDGISFYPSLIEDYRPSKIPNITAWDLFLTVQDSATSADKILRGTNGRGTSSVGNVTASGFFTLMNYTMPRNDPKSWMSTDFLIESARKSFQSVATQVANQYLTQAVKENSTATVSWTANRLVLQNLSFYVITSILVLLIAIATTLLFSTPSGVVPRDPGSIAGIAAIVASSSELNGTLKGAGHSATLTKSRAISSSPFQTGMRGQQFRVRARVVENELLELPGPRAARRQQWWRPFYGSLVGKLVILITPLAGIATVEAMYQTSLQHQGIADVSLSGFGRYSWTYVPALIVFALNLGFESVYDLSTLVQPYHILRRGAATAEDALTYNLQGKVLLHNVWLALRNRRYMVFFASLSVLLGTSLPIIVAGLYTPEKVARLTSLTLKQTTYFNASQGFYQGLVPIEGVILDGDEPPPSKQNNDPLAQLILYNNLSYPPGTYETFALGQFVLPEAELPNLTNGTYSSVTAQVPAVRGRVNCTSVPQSNIYLPEPNELATPLNFSESRSDIESITPEGCWNNTGTWNWLVPTYTDINNYTEKEFIFGKFIGAQVYKPGDWPIENKTISDVGYHGDRAMSTKCPRGMIVFGRGIHENKTGVASETFSSVTVMHCWPYVEQLMLNTTFSGPSRKIVSANPLSPDPEGSGGYPFFSEAEILENVGHPLVRGPPKLWTNYLSFMTRPNDTTVVYAFDAFMEAVVWGKDGIPAVELLGPENADRLVSRIDKIYGIIMAQLYNNQARIPVTNADALNGIAVNEQRHRIVQSLISTRILEAVLAAMFICCALSLWLLDTRELLPQNPCSIAAVASFVADSRLRDIIPKGSEFLSDRDMTDSRMFKGLKFRMDWWGEGKDKRFGIDIVDHGT